MRAGPPRRRRQGIGEHLEHEAAGDGRGVLEPDLDLLAKQIAPARHVADQRMCGFVVRPMLGTERRDRREAVCGGLSLWNANGSALSSFRACNRETMRYLYA